MRKSKIDIPIASREKATVELNKLLACTADLSFAARQAHWNVRGESFMALHELFGGLYERMDGFGDTIAERIVALGGQAVGTLQSAAKASMMPKFPTDITAQQDVLRALISSWSEYGAYVRSGFPYFTQLKDDTTANMMLTIAEQVDKDLWWLEAHVT